MNKVTDKSQAEGEVTGDRKVFRGFAFDKPNELLRRYEKSKKDA